MVAAFSGCRDAGGDGSSPGAPTIGEEGFEVQKPPVQANDSGPNFIVVVTDDQTLESFNEDVMPRTVRTLAEQGTTFSQAIVSTPQCCPSRAGYLTGQYAQNNGVTSNDPGYSLLLDKPNVLSSWLQAAGYETIHVGRFLNGYPVESLVSGPGWDSWLTLINLNYLESGWAINGAQKTYPGTYLTATLNSLAASAIRRHAGTSRPFYLQVDHLAPHEGSGTEVDVCQGSAVPDPRDAGAFSRARAPRNPAAREADLSDKPAYLGRRPEPPPAAVAEADRKYRCTLESLQSVDRGVSKIVSVLREEGELGKTMIVFTSDNGYAFLEHRVPTTKRKFSLTRSPIWL